MVIWDDQARDRVTATFMTVIQQRSCIKISVCVLTTGANHWLRLQIKEYGSDEDEIHSAVTVATEPTTLFAWVGEHVAP